MLVHTPRGEQALLPHRAEVLVPQGPRRQVSCGTATARTPRPRADLQPLSRQGRGWRGTPIGLLTSLGGGGIDTDGLGVTPGAIAKLLEVDVEGWKQQLP